MSANYSCDAVVGTYFHNNTFKRFKKVIFHPNFDCYFNFKLSVK